jgi:hypothetical protein
MLARAKTHRMSNRVQEDLPVTEVKGLKDGMVLGTRMVVVMISPIRYEEKGMGPRGT